VTDVGRSEMGLEWRDWYEVVGEKQGVDSRDKVNPNDKTGSKVSNHIQQPFTANRFLMTSLAL